MHGETVKFHISYL